MKKFILALIVLVASCLFIFGCAGDGGDDNSQRYYGGGGGGGSGDTDGDGVPDHLDCAPNDPDRWQSLQFWPDADEDGLPDSYISQLFCVGLPATYPEGWTLNAPPPLDPCPGDPTNTCLDPPPLQPTILCDWAIAMDGEFFSTFYGSICTSIDGQDPSWQVIQSQIGHDADTGNRVICEVNPNAINQGEGIFNIHYPPGMYVNPASPWGITPMPDGSYFDWLLASNGDINNPVFYEGTGLGSPACYIDLLDGNGYLPLNVTRRQFSHAPNYVVDFMTTTDPGGSEVNIIVGIRQDTDDDGILNPDDNCILVSNPGQESSPGNIIGANGLPVGDACIGYDSDNDGVVDWLDNCPLDPTCW